MCNAHTSSNDQTSIPRVARGGHIWINLFGRDWVVRRRRPSKLGITGAVLAALGVIGLAWGSVDDFKPDRVGIVLAVIGLGIIGYRRLETKNLAGDEIWRLAYDTGREDGYDEGYKDRGTEMPLRPVVVPLNPTCDICGGPVARVRVGS